MFRSLVGVGFFAFTLMANACSAAFVLNYSLDGNLPPDAGDREFVVNLNEDITVSVFIFETPGENRLSTVGNGVLTAGFGVRIDPTQGEIVSRSLESPFLAALNETVTEPGVSGFNLSGLVFPPDPVQTNGERGLKIGSFVYRLTTPEAISLTFVDPQVGPENNVIDGTALASPLEIDAELFSGPGNTSPVSLTLTAIPEPSSALLLAVVGGYGITMRRRRR